MPNNRLEAGKISPMDFMLPGCAPDLALSPELFISIDTDALARSAYEAVRIKIHSNNSDSDIAKGAYCHITPFVITRGLNVAGVTSARVESHEIGGPRVWDKIGFIKKVHNFSVIPDPEDFAMRDIVFDCAYNQFLVDDGTNRPDYFIGTREEIIKIVTRDGRDPMFAELYLPSSDIVRGQRDIADDFN